MLFYSICCFVQCLHCFLFHLLDPCNVNMSLSPTHLDYFLGGKIIIIYILENIPLVKFIKTTSGTQVVYFP